jgi:hypothetical protein
MHHQVLATGETDRSWSHEIPPGKRSNKGLAFGERKQHEQQLLGKNRKEFP